VFTRVIDKAILMMNFSHSEQSSVSVGLLNAVCHTCCVVSAFSVWRYERSPKQLQKLSDVRRDDVRDINIEYKFRHLQDSGLTR